MNVFDIAHPDTMPMQLDCIKEVRQVYNINFALQKPRTKHEKIKAMYDVVYEHAANERVG